jgi:cytochrome c oxidase subunit 4
MQPAAAETAAAAAPESRPHPNYIGIFGILFVLTVVEVGVAFVGLPKRLTIFALVLLALWKALLVALYYMHLRYEPGRLRLLALVPLPLAIILVIAVLTEF